MSKKSLPSLLYYSLEHHARASDISDDQELREILGKLDHLNSKVEAIKQRARILRARKATN